MNFRTEVTLGNARVEITDEVKNTLELFKRVSFFTQLPTKCGNCGAEDLFLSYRNPQGYDYFGIKCKACGYELKFGISKERPGELFTKDWEAPYNGNGTYTEEEVEETPTPKKTVTKTTVKKAAPIEEEIEEIEEESEEVEVENKVETTTNKQNISDIVAKYKAKVQKSMKAQV